MHGRYLSCRADIPDDNEKPDGTSGAAMFIRSTGQYQLTYGSGPGFARVREGTNDMLEHTSVPAGTRKPSSKRKAQAASPLNFCIILSKDGRIDRQNRPAAGGVPRGNPGGKHCLNRLQHQRRCEGDRAACTDCRVHQAPHPQTLYRFYSAYEDYDTELGIMLPLGDHQKRHHDGPPALCFDPGKTSS